MSLSRPQAGASANTTNVAITSTAQGDLIVVFAYNKTNATIPTLPAGFTSLGTATTATGAARVGYKYSAGGDTSSGTWTNATNVACLVFRSSLGPCYPGAFLTNTGSGTTLTWLAFNSTNGQMQFRTSGTSWVAGFGGARSATAGMNGNTTGGTNNLTNETSQTNVNGLDSEAAIASFGTNETLAVTTTGEWITATVEILEPAGELSGNPTASVGMYAQAIHQDNLPGYARKLRLGSYDPLDLMGGAFARFPGGVGAAGSPERTYEGTTGVNFGWPDPVTGNRRSDLNSPTADGTSAQLQRGPGRSLMLVPVVAGANTLTIDVRYWPDSGAGKRPRLLAKRDLDVGVQDDVSAEAPASDEPNFVTITLNVTVSAGPPGSAPVLEVYREQQDTRADAWVIWDNFAVA